MHNKTAENDVPNQTECEDDEALREVLRIAYEQSRAYHEFVLQAAPWDVVFPEDLIPEDDVPAFALVSHDDEPLTPELKMPVLPIPGKSRH